MTPDIFIVHYGTLPRAAENFDLKFSLPLLVGNRNVNHSSGWLDGSFPERDLFECGVLVLVAGPGGLDNVPGQLREALYKALAFRARHNLSVLPVVIVRKKGDEERLILEPLRTLTHTVIPESYLMSGNLRHRFGEDRIGNQISSIARVSLDMLTERGPLRGLESSPAAPTTNESKPGDDAAPEPDDSTTTEGSPKNRLPNDVFENDSSLPSIPPDEPRIPPRPLPPSKVEVEGMEGQTDEVSCSVFAPRMVEPGDEMLIQVFAYLPEHSVSVEQMALEADPAAERLGSRPLSEAVTRGERLGFHLSIRGVEIDEPDQEFVWRGEPLAAQFGVFFPEDSRPRNVVGTVIVTKESMPVGHVKFTFRVMTPGTMKKHNASNPVENVGDFSGYRKAFISYASKDRVQVLPRVQALAAAGIDVFQDFIGLEPGDRWEQGLYKHIDESDVFFLFWSQAARDSKWVLKEAEYARARQAENEESPPEIIPIIIEGPPPVKPPPELGFLHFNDKYIYLLKGVEAEAEARRERG